MQAKRWSQRAASLIAAPHDTEWRPAPWPAWDVGRFAARAATLILVRLGLYDLLARGRLADAMCQWDCHWYVIVARYGYDPVLRLMRGHWQPDWAFFPLLPFLMRGVAWLTDVSPPGAGVLVASAALLVFAVAGHAYRRRTRPLARPWPWLLLVMAWPYGVYFQAPYTESLFAALVCLCLLAVLDRRPWLAASACGLLSATRPNAILVTGWFGLRCLYRAARAGTPVGAMSALAPAALAPFGLLAFMGLLWARLGDPLAFIHAQGAWGHALRDPALVLADAVRSVGSNHAHLGLLYNAGWALLGLAVAAAMLARGRRAEAWLCGGTVVMALLSGTLWSMPRYVAGNPVVIFAAADLLDKVAAPQIRTALLIVSATIQVALVMAWFHKAAFLV